MARVVVKWCDGPHGKACRDRPHKAWRIIYCTCPCHDRPRLVPKVPGKWKIRIAWGITIAVILAVGIAAELYGGSHIAWTMCKWPCGR